MSISDLLNLNSPRGLLGNSFGSTSLGTSPTNNNFQVSFLYCMLQNFGICKKKMSCCLVTNYYYRGRVAYVLYFNFIANFVLIPLNLTLGKLPINGRRVGYFSRSITCYCYWHMLKWMNVDLTVMWIGLIILLYFIIFLKLRVTGKQRIAFF